MPSTNRPTPLPVSRTLREVADHLTTWRKLRTLTQLQVAERAGVSRDTVARFERGDGGISFESLLRILRALGLLDVVPHALDPYESDVGRLRSDERLPARVRPRNLGGRDNG